MNHPAGRCDEPCWRPAPASFPTPLHEAEHRSWIAVGRQVAAAIERACATPCVATIDRAHKLARLDFCEPWHLISALRSDDVREICRWLTEGTSGKSRNGIYEGESLMPAVTGKSRQEWLDYQMALSREIHEHLTR
jgi:hypothetical protein